MICLMRMGSIGFSRTMTLRVLESTISSLGGSIERE